MKSDGVDDDRSSMTSFVQLPTTRMQFQMHLGLLNIDVRKQLSIHMQLLFINKYGFQYGPFRLSKRVDLKVFFNNHVQYKKVLHLLFCQHQAVNMLGRDTKEHHCFELYIYEILVQ